MATIMLLPMTFHGYLLTSCVFLSVATYAASDGDGSIIAKSGDASSSIKESSISSTVPDILEGAAKSEAEETEIGHIGSGTVKGPHKCPAECSCGIDNGGRLEVLCLRGDMRKIPVHEMDRDTAAIVIRGPRNQIQLAAVLQPLQQLQVLRVTEANIPTIGKNTFWGVPTLKLLDLSRNNVTSLSEDNFRGQDNLLELDLSRNKLNKLPVATFRHLRELRSLSLAHNLIEELVQRIFFAMVRLRYLDLSYNPFHDLSPDIFKDIQELAVLKCRQCRLENLNPMFYNLLQLLVELDLGENRFKYFNREEFRDLKRLRVLRLDGNLLSVVVDNLFAAQRSLTFLDVARNRLAKVTNRAFASLGNCTYLDLSYNKLSQLSGDSMAPLKSLRVLNISGNVQMDLTDIKPAFQKVHEITTLSVADMGTLPMGLLLPLTNLKSLNLSGNHMDNVSLFVLTPISTLQELDLSHNQISGIEETIASRLLNIANVRLDNNPLICDKCHLGPLIGKVKLLKWKLPPICFFPDQIRGTAVNELREQDIDNCVEIIENEDLDAASTSYNFLESGNLSVLAICIGIAAGILLVLLIVFTLVLSSRGNNNARQRDNSLTTTRCQYTTSSSSDMLKSPSGGVFVGITAEDVEKTTEPNGYNNNNSNNNITEKSGHELLFPENMEMGRDGDETGTGDEYLKHHRQMSSVMATRAKSPNLDKTMKTLKEVSFSFPMEDNSSLLLPPPPHPGAYHSSPILSPQYPSSIPSPAQFRTTMLLPMPQLLP